jgi:hypothetical protein
MTEKNHCLSGDVCNTPIACIEKGCHIVREAKKEMTEPIKLPPFSPNLRVSERQREFAQDYARLAVEQATAELRAELAAVTERAENLDRAKEFMRCALSVRTDERDEARAELARLTTLRPIKTAPTDGTEIMLYNGKRRATGFYGKPEGWANPKMFIWPYIKVNPTHWTPLPPVKEADK